MLRSETVIKLYNNVMNYDMLGYNIPVEAVRTGIKSMTEIYKPDNSSLESKASNLADFNNAAYRCAYLHKYAAFHTSMVYDMMFEAVKTNFNLFYDIVFSTNRFRLVSLGGGPGTDVIGVLAALHTVFSYIPTSVAVVDCMVNWSYSFRSILRELGSGFYGSFGNNVYQYLDWRYIYSDLLQSLTPEVSDALSSASLVTMIKFASAAACVDTKNMVENIFTAMKPGAVLLFIDNDGGGYRQLIMKAASEHGFISIFGPLIHANYENDAMKIIRFGHVSCFKSTVAVHVLQKPWADRYNKPVENFYSPLLDIPLTRYAPSVPLFGNTPSPYAPSVPLFNNALPSYTPVSYFENPSIHYPHVQPNNSVTPHQFLGTFDFTQDYPCNDNAVLDIPQRPSHLTPPFVNTPISTINSPVGLENIQPSAIYTEKGIRRSKKSMQKFRKRLRQKLNNVKSQTSSSFKKPKVEKVNTPISTINSPFGLENIHPPAI